MPIVNGKYKNPGWTDNARPPIDASNLNDISDTLEKLDAGGGGGGGTVRAVVGTSAAGWTAADCDYLCDGTADDVEINQALTAAYQAGGGEVRILAGTYNLTATVSVEGNVHLSGDGMNASKLVRQSGNYTAQFQAMVYLKGNLSALSLEDNTSSSSRAMVGADVTGAAGVFVSQVYFNGGAGASAIQVIASAVTAPFRVDGCVFRLYDGKIIAAGALVASTLLVNNTAHMGGAVSVAGQGMVTMYGNQFPFSEITLDGIENHSLIANNVAASISLLASAGAIPRVSSACLICDNVLYTLSGAAITLGTDTTYNFVTGNQLTNFVGGTQSAIQDSGTGNIVRFNSDDAGGGGVTSFNGRTGAVVPQSGDYTAAMVGTLPITYGTADLTPGTSSLTTDNVYFVYE